MPRARWYLKACINLKVSEDRINSEIRNTEKQVIKYTYLEQSQEGVFIDTIRYGYSFQCPTQMG